MNHGPDGEKAVQQRIGIFTTEMISIQRDDLVFGQIAFDVVGNNWKKNFVQAEAEFISVVLPAEM